MKTGFLLLGFIFLANDSFARQSNSTKLDKSIKIAEINGESITLGQLITSFNKNHEDDEISNDELMDFLPSFINYKLKLKEGRRLGFHQHPEILEEFEQFGREAAYIYWLEREIKEEQIQEFMERDRYELKAFHILSEVPEGSSAAFEDSVYNRMVEARNKLLEGIAPEQVNKDFSSNRNGQSMGGALPWITAGRTVLEFEDALYALEPGEISNPVRTQFGYHIIFLQNKRERTPDRRVSHIFTQKSEQNDGINQIQQAHHDLQNGLPWQEAVQNYSQDGASVNRNGQIGWIGYAMQFPEEFVDEVMQADPDASFSKPIEMSYGYHIIRIDSVRTYPDTESYKKAVLNRLEQLQRFDTGREQVYETVARVGKLTVHNENLSNLHNYIADQTLSKTMQDDISLFDFNEKTYTLADFFKYLNEEERLYSTTDYSDELFTDFKKEAIRSELISITKNHNPGFKQEISSFLDGLVVFKVNEEFIWSHETVDRSELRTYFKENRDRYVYDEQYEFYRVSSLQQDLTEDALNNVRDGIHPSDLPELFDDISILHDSTRSQQSTHFPYISELSAGEVTDIIERGSLHSFYYLVKIEPSRPMTFDEAFFQVASDYQPIREEQFMKRLRNTWQVTLYTENIQ